MTKKNAAKKIITNVIYPIISLAIALSVWAIVSAIKNNPLVLPMPGIVIERFFLLMKENSFWISVFSTLGRTIVCFAVSFLVALILALAGRICSPVHKILMPLISVLRSAPTVAVILIAYAFFSSKIMACLVGFLIAFPVLYSSFFTALNELNGDLFTLAKVYKISFLHKIFGITIPQIAPVLFDAGASTLSLTVKVIISAEIITCVANSIGGKVQTAYASFEIEYLLAWTLVAIVLSFLLEFIVNIAKKLTIRW